MSRVLLVEDDTNLRDALGEVLTGAGHHVTVAHDGMEAVRLAPDAHPQVIVSDVMMPVMNGPDMVRAIRAMPAYDSLPVILMSALITTAPVPVVAMLRKPFAPATLLNLLDTIPDAPEPHASAMPRLVVTESVAAQRIRRGIELAEEQQKRVHVLQSMGIDTRLAEELHNALQGSIKALVLFSLICRSDDPQRPGW
jgi:CheY-like chemotaxis protein